LKSLSGKVLVAIDEDSKFPRTLKHIGNIIAEKVPDITALEWFIKARKHVLMIVFVNSETSHHSLDDIFILFDYNSETARSNIPFAYEDIRPMLARIKQRITRT
jgi:phosphohistidine swiveling domain-containing protein